MNKILSTLISSMLVAVIYTGCSQQQMADFQKNDQEPAYNLLDLFGGFPALDSAVSTLDSQGLNNSLGDMLLNGYETPDFLRDASGLVQAPFLVPMLNEVHGLLRIMLDASDYHYKDSIKTKGYYDETDNSIDRLGQFYSALDQVVDNTELSSDILVMATKVVDYLVEKKFDSDANSTKMETDMGTMMKVRVFQHCMYDTSGYAIDLPVGDYALPNAGIATNDISSLKIPIGMKVTLYDASSNSVVLTSDDRCLTDNQVGSTANYWNDRATRIKVEYDISKLAKLLGKMTMSCDYPMWVNSSNVPPADRVNANSGAYTINTDLGDAVKGLIKLLHGLNAVVADDSQTRDIIDDIILEDVPGLLNATDSTAKMKNTIINLSEYFGTHEFGDNAYDTVADYHNSNPYVNASLKETVRDMVPNITKLFIRDDDSSTLDDTYKMFKNINGRSPVEELTVSLAKLKDAGIDYNTVSIEPSIKRMLLYNGRGRLRASDSSWSSLSYLDHLVFAIAGSYNFGFLTRTSGGQGEEPVDNFGYNHGTATKGVITINDSMYSMTSAKVEICNIGLMGAYDLALSARNDQGNRIGRSSSPFTTGQFSSHKFYMGYDYPTLGLLPSGCAGDAGIPNGGQTAVNNPSDGTGTEGSNNDYRTYFPKVSDGKGVLNTAQFLMGWLARACWDGGGPYYYSPEKGGTSSDTITFSWPGAGNRTVYRYYKPNGEVYAYVYKPNTGNASTWEFWYPHKGHTTENANDVSDNPLNTSDVSYQRANRYQEVLKSDYWVIQRRPSSGFPLFQDELFLSTPMYENGNQWVDDDNKYHLNSTSDQNKQAGYFKFFEKIPEKSASRECKSQEEAMFRNLQWFLLEKKFVFTIPMWVDAIAERGGAFIVIEANGAVGLANARKQASTNANAKWVFKGDEGLPGNAVNPNYNLSPDYGDSSIPGDGRIIVFTRKTSAIVLTINADYLFNTILGNGYVLPDAVGRNIDPVARMGFLEESGNIASANASIGVDGTTLWDSRNKFFPLLLAITGTLWEGTDYTTASSGNNYNYPATKHKYPLADLLEGIFIPLSKPLLRYYTADNRWVPRVKTESGYDYQYFNPNTTHEADPVAEQGPYLPREVASNGTTPLRTVLSVLTGNAANETNGLLPMLTDNTKLVTRLMALLQKLGENANSAERQDIALGLEQVMTSMKINKSEAINAGYHKTLDYSNYQWVFTQRNEDISLEDFLGYEGPFRTDQTAQWTDFEDSMNTLKQFVGGSRDITPNLVNIVNAILAQSLTEDQVHGLLYTAGKLFAKHDTAWHYQGDDHGPAKTDSYDQLLDLLTYLPQVHGVMKSSGGNGKKYGRMVKNLRILLRDHNSLVYYLLNTMNTPYSMQYIIEDLDRFMSWSIVSDPNSPLWDDLVLMLEAMADMNDPRVDISQIIESLGLQAN